MSLFLMGGPTLDDPHGLLKGEGGRVRHIVPAGVATLDDPRVRALMDQALALRPIPVGRSARLIIQAVSAKQRPRRPA